MYVHVPGLINVCCKCNYTYIPKDKNLKHLNYNFQRLQDSSLLHESILPHPILQQLPLHS